MRSQAAWAVGRTRARSDGGVAAGPVLIRASVHGLVVNIVQSLCTSVQLPEDNLRNLTLLLSQFSEPKYRLLFGVSRGGVTNGGRRRQRARRTDSARAWRAAFAGQDASDDHLEKLSLTSLETIITSLLEVINCSASSPDTATTWLARCPLYFPWWWWWWWW